VPGDGKLWSLVFDFLSGRTGRAVRLAAQAAVLTAVVGGTVAYTHTAKSVTLVVDGASDTVTSDARDVRSLLADEGLTLSARDLVSPGPDTPLHGGDRVDVRFARPLTLTVDGAPHTYWTTQLTVDAALTALGIRADGAQLYPSRFEPLGRTGLGVVLSHPKSVTLVADGRTRALTSSAATVADLLREQGVTVGPNDQLSVLPNAPVVDGLVVALTRIRHQKATVTEPVPAPVVQQPTSGLAAGDQQVVTAGRPGQRTVVYDVLLADGKQTGKTVLSAVIVTEPIAKVVKVGTKPAAPSGGSGGGAVAGADGLNWAALARCESGGNPRAVNPAGYYGLYQFSVSTWRAVGGSGMPNQASASEQLYRAKLLYAKAGAGQWGCGRHLYD
jgi:uncharacterized protein YabE (DUF348 family)